MSSISGSGSGGSGGMGIMTITGDTGGALSGSNITFTGASTGLVFNGSGTTETLGGVLLVPNGGTGISSATAYAPIIAGTTSTGNFQVASTGQSNSGYVLTSTGSSSLPTWQAAAGGGVTVDGDTGSFTGSTIQIVTSGNLGGTWNTVASGSSLSINNSTSTSKNLATGLQCGISLGTVTPSAANSLYGYQCGTNITSTAYNNCAFGTDTLFSFTTGGNSDDGNSAFGCQSLENLLTGSYNCTLGEQSGQQYFSSESGNILIGAYNKGVTGDNYVTRIGYNVNGATTATYIDGIDGVTVSGAAVLVATGGQLGVAVSSAKFKDNIKDMADSSSKALNLRPVTFSYKGGNDTHFGLIAEEVHEVLPELVVYDKAGDPQTVMYHELPAILLNELQKALKRIEALEAKGA